MKLQRRSVFCLSFLVLVTIVVFLSYFLEHVILQLPIVYTVIFIAFEIIILILGAVVVVHVNKAKESKR